MKPICEWAFIRVLLPGEMLGAHTLFAEEVEPDLELFSEPMESL